MTMAASPTQSSENTDALQSLEERILRAVELVSQLRREKEAAAQANEELTLENMRLTEELENLQSERKEVRTRIERLLGQMDDIAS